MSKRVFRNEHLILLKKKQNFPSDKNKNVEDWEISFLCIYIFIYILVYYQLLLRLLKNILVSFESYEMQTIFMEI